MFARYPAWFGKPLFAHIYNPFSILWWIQKIDPTAFIVLPMQHFRPVNPAVHRLVLGIIDHLKWGGGAAVVVGFVAGLMLDRPQRGSGLYGRAHFATARELARSSLRRAQTGIVLGQTSAASYSSMAARRTCSCSGRRASVKRTAPPSRPCAAVGRTARSSSIRRTSCARVRSRRGVSSARYSSSILATRRPHASTCSPAFEPTTSTPSARS